MSAAGWALLVVAVVVVVALVVALVLYLRRRRRWQVWRMTTRGLVDAAFSARELLPARGRDILDVPRWEQVRAQVEQAAQSLDGAAAGAPDAAATSAAHEAAAGLRATTFALESERLVQTASPPPTAQQLADADAATRARRAELDAALGRLDAIVTPPDRAAGPKQA